MLSRVQPSKWELLYMLASKESPLGLMGDAAQSRDGALGGFVECYTFFREFEYYTVFSVHSL